MIVKEYYQLDDLKLRFKLTDSDVLYLISERKLVPCFNFQNTAFIVGGWRNDDFIGYANVKYEGIVAIPDKYIAELVSKRKVTPYFFNLPNCDKIKLTSTEYECGQQVPNKYLQGWKQKNIKQINWPFLPAKPFPYLAPSLGHTVKKFILSFESDETIRSTHDVKLDNAFGKTIDYELTALWKTYHFSDVCIRHEDLVAIGLIDKPVSLQDVKLQSVPTDVNLNAFEVLLLRILNKDNRLSSKSIHKILCAESLLEEDTRQYDVENILLDAVDDVIVWHDMYSKKKQKSCSFRRLENILSKVRNVNLTQD